MYETGDNKYFAKGEPKCSGHAKNKAFFCNM